MTTPASITPEQVYETYYSFVYSRVYQLLSHREQAEDVTHDVFLKAFRALPTLQSSESLGGWLYRIATNTAYDVLRRRRLITWQPLAGEDTLPENTPDIQEHYMAQEAVCHALQQLPGHYQRALILTALAGYSAREVAVLHERAPGGARAYLQRARQAFRNCYRSEV